MLGHYFFFKTYEVIAQNNLYLHWVVNRSDLACVSQKHSEQNLLKTLNGNGSMIYLGLQWFWETQPWTLSQWFENQISPILKQVIHNGFVNWMKQVIDKS